MAEFLRWTVSEIEILKNNYFTATADELEALFPNRCINSIRKKARSMGFHVPKDIEFRNRSTAKSGGNAYNWIGGRKITPKGYVQVLVKGHPRADLNGYVFEHIVVWENCTGIPVQKGFVVHHLDGNKQNNDISNLCLMTFGGHSTYHNKNRRVKK